MDVAKTATKVRFAEPGKEPAKNGDLNEGTGENIQDTKSPSKTDLPNGHDTPEIKPVEVSFPS